MELGLEGREMVPKCWRNRAERTPEQSRTEWGGEGEAEADAEGGREAAQRMADDQSISVKDRVRTAQVEARARHISHNVRCLECGHQSIEESAADIAVRLRKVIRDDIRAGRSDKEIYERLTTEYGETILYSPAFDAQTAVLWLGPVAVIGAIAASTFYRGRSKQRDVGRMADALFHGIPLTPTEHRMLKSLVLPPSQRRAWTWPSLWKL